MRSARWASKKTYGAGKPNIGFWHFFAWIPRRPGPAATLRAGGNARFVRPVPAVPGLGRRPGRAVPSPDGRPRWDGGERFTARPSRRSGQTGTSPSKARAPRNRRASRTARPGDDDSLDAYVKKVVDRLPPLTDEQRDLLSLIFRNNRRQPSSPLPGAPEVHERSGKGPREVPQRSIAGP